MAGYCGSVGTVAGTGGVGRDLAAIVLVVPVKVGAGFELVAVGDRCWRSLFVSFTLRSFAVMIVCRSG